eukprot:12547079-Alexandrium_andersonii.AAC.1
MRRAREVDTRPTALVDVVFRPRSPLTVAMQYISAVFRGASGRCRLIWQSSGEFMGFEAWCHEREADMVELRRLLLVTAASFHCRHVCMYQAFPWLLVQFGAPDIVPEQVRTELANEWDALQPCCCPSGFSRRLKAQ